MEYKKIRLKDSDGNILYPEVSGKSITDLGNNFIQDSYGYWEILLGTDGGLEDNNGFLFVKLSTDTSSGDPAGIEIAPDGGLRARVSPLHYVYLSDQGYLDVRTRKGLTSDIQYVGDYPGAAISVDLGSGLTFDDMNRITVRLGSGLELNNGVITVRLGSEFKFNKKGEIESVY